MTDAAPQRFRAAVERADLDGMLEPLAADIRLYSPVAFRPFVGHEQVRVLFSHLLEVFEDFHYVDELAGHATHALIFRAHLGPTQVEGLDYLRLDGSGFVSDFTVMVRPLSAAIALAQQMGPRLEHLAKG